MAAISLTLPKPHEKQWAIKHHLAKRQVICAGRRAGKTTLAGLVACERALEGRRVLLAAPTQEQTDAFWEKCKEWLAPLVQSGYVYKNEQRRVLDFPGGGRIRAKTAWDADTLRGDYADFLVLDEYALMDSSTWTQVGAPMLLDNDGDAWFISTPRRKNHFFQLYARAIQDGKRWKEWHFTSHDNPHLSETALAEITQDMSEDDYKQEILAEFLESEGAVFRKIDACMKAPLNAKLEDHREEIPDTKPKRYKPHYIVAGIDWGKKQDFTAISVCCRDCMVEVAKDRFNQIDYHVQRGRLVSLAQKWGVRLIMPESNSMGEPIIDELKRDDALKNVRIEPFETTSTSKPQLIENLALSFERGEVQWLADPVWQAELEAYEVRYSPQTGRPRYGAPEGVHDDTVMARALARRAMQKRKFMIGFA